MTKENKTEILPVTGLISIEDLAKKLKMNKYALARNLKARNVRVIKVGSSLLSKKLVRLEDL